LFPSTYQQTVGLWERDHIVIVRGKVSAKGRDGTIGDEVKILADDAREVTHEQAAAYQATGRKQRTLKVGKKQTLATRVTAAKAERDAPSKPTRVYIRIAASNDNELLRTLKAIIDSSPGDQEVVLVLGTDTAKQAVKLPSYIDPKAETMLQLSALVGDENVKIQ